MLTRTSGIILSSDHPQFESAKEALTYKGTSWDDTPFSYDLFEKINENEIKIPRFYPVQGEVDDDTEIGDKINIKSSIVPRNDRQKKSIKFLTSSNHGILKLEPGTGKTVIAIDSITKIGRKVIIFVHKDSLRKNWKEEFLKHTNAVDDDIAFLNTKKPKEHFDKPIIISTVQGFISGLKKEDFKSELRNAKIGTCFFDECHATIGPEKFSNASMNLNARRIFGLSATPVRFDMQKILKWHLGEVKYFTPEDDELIRPIVHMCHFNFGVYAGKTKNYIMWGGKFQYSRYYKQMASKDAYMKKVSAVIRNAYLKLNRKILVLGSSVVSLIALAESCKFPKESIGIFIPSATEKQKLSVSDITDIYEAFQTKDVVFSTYGACRDGNNRPELDCLVMMTPTGNVEQAGGRVLRYLKDKPQPIIIDLVDLEGPLVWAFNETDYKDYSKKVPQFVKSAQKRVAIYDELGWDYKIRKL